MKRSGIQRRSAPLSRGSGLKAKPHPKLGVQERQEALEFKFSVDGQPCAVCGHYPWDPTPHHVVYRQHCPAGMEWDLRDVLAVCKSCHGRHHDGSDFKIPLECLTADNLAFAREVKGDGWADYLRRRYAGSIVGERNGPAAQERPGPGQRRD